VLRGIGDGGKNTQGIQLRESNSGNPTQGIQLRESNSGNPTFLQVPHKLLDFGFIFAALVLLLAAATKLYWIHTESLWEDIAVGGAWLTIPAIVAESWVAGCLLFSPSRLTAGFLGLALHSAFLVFGVGLWLTGTNCQCFGDISALGVAFPAWLLPVYNLMAIIFFAITIRQTTGVVPSGVLTGWIRPRWWPKPSEQTGIALGITVLLFFWSTVHGQQLWRPRMTANQVILEIPELGPFRPDTEYKTEINIRNRLSTPIRIVGGGTSCSCLTLDSIPLVIPGNGNRQLVVRFTVGKHFEGQQEFRNSLVYFVEGARQFQVRGVVRGAIDN